MLNNLVKTQKRDWSNKGIQITLILWSVIGICATISDFKSFIEIFKSEPELLPKIFKIFTYVLIPIVLYIFWRTFSNTEKQQRQLSTTQYELEYRMDTIYLNLLSAHCSLMGYFEATDLENELILPLVESDSNTLYVGKNKNYFSVTSNCKEFTHQYRDDYSEHYDNVFKPFLRNSKWIAHTDFENSTEKIEETTYILQRSFNIPNIKFDNLLSASLYIMADEDCTVNFNNRYLRTVKGYKRIHFVDLLPYLRTEDNTIELIIDNTSSRTFTPYGQNVYGVRFCIRIACKAKKNETKNKR